MSAIKLIGLRVGVLGLLVVVTDLLLPNTICRDLAVLLGQAAVEWLLLGPDAVSQRPPRRRRAFVRGEESQRRAGGDDE
ncbi:hypothetical protein [Nocardia terpenica]|uniref:Uncharacterized protein n=1 Tax=Nocardia terpenica TaxID=455432 RepID=A0A291RPD5_9NOCA|nr:hypothetical protein [Nocardia terpenica]ATL69170.1 hypothetical protein CRH09_26315 [Nocardia terpenica]